MNTELAELEESINLLRSEYKMLLIEVQATCSHEHVVERDYFKIAPWMDAHRPVRICKECGLCEEGWGCGYIVIKNPVTVERIGRDMEYHYCRGKRIFDADKGPLLRKEKSVIELLGHL